MHIKRRHAAVLLTFTALVFVVLYRRFLFGNAVYLYTDVGSDSMSSSYPILVMLSRLFQNGDFSFYTLSSGLGADTSATFLQYINPLKFFLLLFDRDSMPYGLLLQLFLSACVTAYAAWRYLDLLTGDSLASVAGALLFAYSGYSVLWSQNLSYGICVAMFAVSMWAVEAFIRFRTWPRFLALAGILALSLFSNYFFSYMTALFVILYLPLRAAFRKENGRTFLKQFFGTGAAACTALILSAAAVAAIACTFLSSVRTGDASRSLVSFLKKGIDVRMLFACAARLFSENLTGTGNQYTGPDNYYEIAVLFTSALFFFSFFYLLYRRKSRFKVLIPALLAAAALLLPVCRYILNMNWLCMRFSFWISFAECIAITYFVRDLFRGPDRKATIFSVVCTLIVTAAAFTVFVLTDEALGFEMSLRGMAFSGACILLGALGVVLLLLKAVPSRFVPVLLLLALSGEIVIMHHDTLYLREYVRKESWKTSPYSESKNSAAALLREEDGDLYRVSSTDEYLLANEGLVDGFNGTSLYNNVNPASLLTLSSAHGTNEVSTPYFISGYPQYYQFTLLSGRYLMLDESVSEAATDPALFEKTGFLPGEEDGGGTVIYRNRNALPFGYLTGTQIPEKDYLNADLVTRMHLLTRHWFLTGESSADQETASAKDEAAPDPAGDDVRTDLIESAVWKDPHNLTMTRTSDDIRFTVTGEDPYIYVYFDTEGETANTSRYLHLEMDTAKSAVRDIAFYYLQDEKADPSPDWIGMAHYNKRWPEALLLLPDRIAGFRFDLDDRCGTAVLESLELVTCEDPSSHFSALAGTQISNISFAHDLYQADVSADGDGMLCVPLLYSSCWSAAVNGSDAEVYNINGGLTGIKVGKGLSHVEMRYSVPYFRQGAAVSTAAALLWLAALVFTAVRAKRSGASGKPLRKFS